MTFEEIQKNIEGMLAVQKELQLGQLKMQENQQKDRQQIEQMLAITRELQERQIQFQDAQERERETLQVMASEMTRFIERSNRNERRIEQLIGYSLTNESEHLDIEQRFRNLEARLSELESRQ